MNTITITKQMIADEICGRLCRMVESNQSYPFELSDQFILIRNWTDKDHLMVTYDQILNGYRSFDGNKATRIPEFISKDWDKSFNIYKRLKNI
jgi:hypothetical protein